MTRRGGEIATLAAYYAVLALLAAYGAHRVLMVWLYYRHRTDDAAARRRSRSAPPRHRPASDLQRSLRRRAPGRGRRRARLPAGACSRSRSSTTRPTRRAASPGASRERLAAPRVRHRPSRRASTATASRPARCRPAWRRPGASTSRSSTRTSCPGPDFLREALPHFADPRVGVVQARWDHLNRDFSLLTRIQSIFLDGHFVVEHTARHRSGRFFNFNGTAGVWRRSCLEDAGGWQSDTLTEDLDCLLPRAAARAGSSST